MDIISKINNFFSEDINQMNSLIKKIISNHEELINKVADHLISSGGKKLRPILTMICSKLCNYQGNRHINLAAAVEFIHTATLLHDDVVDNSKLRRNMVTANDIWGNKSSILVGDFLLSQAFKLMVIDGSIKILDVLSSASAIIAEGEVMQLAAVNDITLSYDNYLNIVKYKTAELFAASCQIGALIAENDEEYTLRNFGMNLGIAFQIIDDYLDYFAVDNSTGKIIGNDFFESKITLPIIIVYEKSNKDEKLFLRSSFASIEKNEKTLSDILNLLNKYEVKPIVFEYANKYIEIAKSFINIFPDSEIKKILIETLDFSLKRVY